MAVIKISDKDTRTRIKGLFKNLQELESSKDNQIDMKNVQWVSPLSLLPLAAKITKNFSNPDILMPDSQYLKDYLKIISFPNGISNYTENLYTSYLPILHFSVEKEHAQYTGEHRCTTVFEGNFVIYFCNWLTTIFEYRIAKEYL